MFYKILEKMDSLFTVNQTKQSWNRVIATFTLAVIVCMSPFLYIKYEESKWEIYLDEYTQAKELVLEYHGTHGKFPIGEKVVIQKEKDLRIFFEENKLRNQRELYYIDTDIIKELQDFKYTYIIDVNNNFLFTREYIIYRMQRWHYAREI